MTTTIEQKEIAYAAIEQKEIAYAAFLLVVRKNTVSTSNLPMPLLNKIFPMLFLNKSYCLCRFFLVEGKNTGFFLPERTLVTTSNQAHPSLMGVYN